MQLRKGLLRSKTIIGLLMALLIFILQETDRHLPLLNEMEVGPLVEKYLQLFGMILAIYGRIKANKRISL